ncbi:MAG: tetratricopeptide repeat protein, partial [Bacteroidetes bacterium]|nr:tetratricopeptide repeat protein [Bacteroidota bacterium]
KLAPLFREFGNKDLGEEGVEHQILADLSIVYYRLGNYKKAIEVYHQQAPYTKGLYGIHESSRLNNLGLCHMELKENDSALYFFNRALIKCEELIEKEQSEEELRNLISFQYVVKANIADVLVQSGDYRDAQKTYEAQLQYSHKEWYPHLVLSSYLSLAKLQYEQADLKKAELYLDSLEVQHRKTPYLRYYVQALQLRHDIYLEQGNRREANEAMVLWKHIQDSLDYVKSQREYQVSAVRFETDLTQRQLMVTQSDLNKEKELNRYQSIGLILAILLVVVFLFGYRVLRKKNRLLFQQQSELSLALGERELLLKEVHHRVKNNLNIVIAILRNQSNKFRDNNTQPLFSNASSFIMSMSKIHEFLYNQDNFSKVDMDSYLDSILLEFGGTYRNKNVQLKLTHGGVRLNVDQAQALSILLCELIINSMKYAFSEKGGSIEIALMQTDGDNCHFQYQDSGSGFDLKNSKPSTFGIRLIQMTTEQLHGQLKLLTDGIFKVNIVFPIR